MKKGRDGGKDMDYVHAGAGGDIELPATVSYNSYNSAVNRLFKALKSIKDKKNTLYSEPLEYEVQKGVSKKNQGMVKFIYHKIH